MGEPRALDGILVVALEQAVAAPLATCRLADAGARVIKIERDGGDFARGYDKAANGVASYFAWLNRGKESVVLDVKDPADKTVLINMLRQADVFVQNLSVGAVERLGLGYDDLRAINPHLIMCSISGFGSAGPNAKMKAYDLLIQAESGLISISGGPGELGRVGVSVADIGTGTNAALAINEALLKRQKTGHGEHLELSLFDVLAEWMTVPLLHQDYLDAAPKRVGLAHPSVAPYGGFEAADGETVLISIQSDREWRDFARDILEDESLGTDPRFATNHARVANRPECDGLISRCFAQKTSAEWADKLKEARIAFGMINDVAGLSRHPHLRRISAEHSQGRVDLPAPPARHSNAPTGGRIPDLDQHGAAIRTEFAANMEKQS